MRVISFSRLTLVIGTIALLILGGNPTASAADDPVVPDAVNTVNEVAPEVLDGAIDTEVSGRSASVTSPETSARYPSTTAGSIHVTSHLGSVDRSYGIGLPDGDRKGLAIVGSDSVTYDNGDGSSTVSAVREDGSLAIATTIESASAPNSYVYPITAGAGHAALTVEPDGSVDVLDDLGQTLTHFLPPWATDADGRDVPTRYSVSNGVLTQIVEHAGFSYPVVADPTSSQYFQKVVIDKSDARGAIVRVYPGNLPAHGTGDALFNDYKTLVTATYEGRKYRDQLVCHWANVSRFKSPWNLDSWRPDVGYSATVAQLCNPN